MKKKQKLMIEELKLCLGVVNTAVKQVGIARSTHYHWMNTCPEYKQAVDEVEDILIDFADSALIKLMEEKSPQAVIFFLKTRGKKRGYVERTEQLVEHSGTEQIKIIIEEKKPEKDE